MKCTASRIESALIAYSCVLCRVEISSLSLAKAHLFQLLHPQKARGEEADDRVMML